MDKKNVIKKGYLRLLSLALALHMFFSGTIAPVYISYAADTESDTAVVLEENDTSQSLSLYEKLVDAEDLSSFWQDIMAEENKDTVMAFTAEEISTLKEKVNALYAAIESPTYDDTEYKDLLLETLDNLLDENYTQESVSELATVENGTWQGTRFSTNSEQELGNNATVTMRMLTDAEIESRQQRANFVIPSGVTVVFSGYGTFARASDNTLSLIYVEKGGTLIVEGLSKEQPLVIDGKDVISDAPLIYSAGTVQLKNAVIQNGNNRSSDKSTGKPNGDGGGIYITATGSLSIEDSVITQNTSSLCGGGIYCNGPMTVNNSVISYNSTGATETKYGAVNAGRGAGFYLNGATAVATLNDTIVEGNKAVYYGGGCHVQKGACLIMNEGTAFRNNSAVLQGAGALHITADAKFVMNGGTIENNFAQTVGGAIHSSYSCVLELNSGKIQNNVANGRGGGIHVNTGGAITLGTGLEVSGNRVNDEASGSAVEVSAQGDILLDTVKKEGTQSNNGYGGGILIDSGTCTVAGATITDNYAEVGGGGIALTMLNMGDSGLDDFMLISFSMTDGEISGNTTDGDGAGVYIMDNKAKQNLIKAYGPEDSEEYQNALATIDKSNKHGFTSDDILYGIPSAKIIGGIISGNISDINGGGFFLGNNTEFNIGGGKVVDNKANQGGGVYVASGTARINGGEMNKNIALTNGGAIYINGNVTMTSGSLSENTAYSGGAISINDGDFVMTSGYIKNNTADECGGAASVNGGNITIGIQECTGNNGIHNLCPQVIYNEAPVGGGFYVTEDGTITMYCGLLDNNSAENDGLGDNLYMDSGVFNYNGGMVGKTENPGAVVVGGVLNDNRPREGEKIDYPMNYHANFNSVDTEEEIKRATKTLGDYLNLPDGTKYWNRLNESPMPYHFVGWTVFASGNISGRAQYTRCMDDYKSLGAAIPIHEAEDGYIDFYALWAPDVSNITYIDGITGEKITVKGNPATYSYSLRKTENTLIHLNSPVKDGYDFIGWRLVAEEGQNTNWSSDAVEDKDTGKIDYSNCLLLGVDDISSGTDLETAQYFGDIQLVAIYETESYTVSYNLNGGEGTIEPQKKVFGIDLTLSVEEPTKDGFVFAGWNTKADGSGNSYAPGDIYAEDSAAVLYAQWSEEIGDGIAIIKASGENIKMNLFNYGPLINTQASGYGFMPFVHSEGVYGWAVDSTGNKPSGSAGGWPILQNVLTEERPFPYVVENKGTIKAGDLSYLFNPEYANRTSVEDYLRNLSNNPDSTYNPYNYGSVYLPVKNDDGSGTGLFQKEGSYFVYDSGKNAAWYNPETQKFELYNYVLRPAYTTFSTSETNGNFLPFNKGHTQGREDYQAETYVKEYTYTNDNGETVEATSTVAKTTTDTIKPEGYDNIAYRLNGDSRLSEVDLWFGMNFEFDFFQPEDGNVDNEPMVFDFLGDDDVFVYVDNVLILDIGGTHGSQTGTINFATGEVINPVKYGQYNDTDGNGHSESNLYELMSLALGDSIDKSQFVDSDGDGDLDTFADFTKHNLKFFYLERGGNISYCKLKFNIPIAPSNGVEVSKMLVEQNGNAFEDMPDVSYTFKLYAAEDDNDLVDASDNKFISLSNTAYKIYGREASDEVFYTDSNGCFTLKAGQRAVFDGITRYTEVYAVEQLPEDNYIYTDSKVSVNGQAAVQYEYGDKTETKVTQLDGLMSFAFTNYMLVMPPVVEKEVTVNYIIIGDDGCGQLSLESEKFNYLGEPGPIGSKVSLNEGYIFDGWYDDEECTQLLSKGQEFIPQKSSHGIYFSDTYYAKITKSTLADKNGMSLNKTINPKDGTDKNFILRLESFLAGTGSTVSQVKVPNDVILILDESGSMNDCIECNHELPIGGGANLGEYVTNEGQTVNSAKESNTILFNNQKAHKVYGSEVWTTQTYKIIYPLDGTTRTVKYCEQCKGWYSDNSAHFTRNTHGQRSGARWVPVTKSSLTPAIYDGYTVTTKGSNGSPNKVTASTLYTETVDGVAKTFEWACKVQFYCVCDHDTERADALKTAILGENLDGNGGFIQELYTSSIGEDGVAESDDDVDNRLAIIGFGNDSPSTLYSYDGTAVAINETNSQQAFKNVLVPTEKNVLVTAVNSIKRQYRTATNRGMEAAEMILRKNPVEDNELRNRIVILFTDGSPGSGYVNYGPGHTTDWVTPAIQSAHRIKNELGATVYTIGLYPGANSSTNTPLPGYNVSANGQQDPAFFENSNHLLHLISSNYPNATSVTATGELNPELNGNNYFYSAQDELGFYNVFNSISEVVKPGTTEITLDNTAVFKDVLTEQFTVAESNKVLLVNAWTESFAGEDNEGNPTWIKDTDSISTAEEGPLIVKVQGRTITVSNFNFSENCVAYDTDAAGNTTPKGKRLVVEAEVTLIPDFLGGDEVNTNSSDSGIYTESGEPVGYFEVPNVDVEVVELIPVFTTADIYLSQTAPFVSLFGIGCFEVNGESVKIDSVNNAYADLVYTITDHEGNSISLTIPAGTKYAELSSLQWQNKEGEMSYRPLLKGDAEYTVSCDIISINDKSNSSHHLERKTVRVFKPEIHFKDTAIRPGNQPYFDVNFVDVVWRHDDEMADSSKMGPAPALEYIYTPENEEYIKDTSVKVDVSAVKDVSIRVPENQDITEYVSFYRNSCDIEGCDHRTESSVNAKDEDRINFIIHLLSSTQINENGVYLDKYVDYDDTTGKGILTLNSYIKGTVESVPTDVVLVIDHSGSMWSAVDPDNGELSFSELDTEKAKREGYYAAFSKTSENTARLIRYYNGEWQQSRVFSTSAVTSYKDGKFIGFINTTLGENRGWTALTNADDYMYYISISGSLYDALNVFMDEMQNAVDCRVAVVTFAGRATKYNASEMISDTDYLGSGIFVDGELMWDNMSPTLRTDVVNGEDAYSRAFEDPATANGRATLLNTVNSINTDYGNTPTGLGLLYARRLFIEAGRPNANKLTLVFTDGLPNPEYLTNRAKENCSCTVNNRKADCLYCRLITYEDANGVQQKKLASTYIDQAYSLKNSQNSVVYSIGPASGYATTEVLTHIATGEDYVYNASGDEIKSVFKDIANVIVNASQNMNQYTVLLDELSDSFELQEDVTEDDILVYTADYAGTDANGNDIFRNKVLFNDAIVDINGKSISVSNFNFKDNTVYMSGLIPHGKKVIIEIPIKKNDDFLGGDDVVTNTLNSGIYNGDVPLAKFPVPEVDIKVVTLDPVFSSKDIYVSQQASFVDVFNLGCFEVNGEMTTIDTINNAYADIVYTVEDEQGNKIQYTVPAGTKYEDLADDGWVEISGEMDYAPLLREDATYTVTCEIISINDNTNRSIESEEQTIKVYKPVISFADSLLELGNKPDFTENLLNIVWMHEDRTANPNIMGPAPVLEFNYTPSDPQFLDDTTVKVEVVSAKDENIRVPENQDVTEYTLFYRAECQYEDCDNPNVTIVDSTDENRVNFIIHLDIPLLINVTVPMYVCMYGYNGDGEVIEPTNYGITNNSNIGVKVTNVNIKPGTWNVSTKYVGLQSLSRGEIFLKMNGRVMNAEDNVLIDNGKWSMGPITAPDNRLILPLESYIAGGNVNGVGCVPILRVTYTIQADID